MVTTVDDLPPRIRRAWKLHERGLTARSAAKEMNCTMGNVYSLWYAARRRLNRKPTPAELERRRVAQRWNALGAAGRCRCGLLLPCNRCLPTILDMAESRRDAE